MAAVMSPQSSSTSPPPAPRSVPSNPNAPALPPLITSPTPRGQRLPSYASKRLSTFSNTSQGNSRSRPQSMAYPLFHSSLPYTLVRDFAYGPLHPLFYGPLPDNPSEISTPASEAQNRRLSDPPPVWDNTRGGWSAAPWEPGEQLPRTSFDDGSTDGPPWSEDEDIHSPVVTSTRHHKKHKSNIVDYDRTGARYPDTTRRGSYTGTNGDGSRTYYVSDLDESANGPGDSSHQRDADMSSPGSSPYDGFYDDDEDSRLSRSYEFTITDPAEEFHGKAVALFDFTSENDNELGLVEGQVILVSYRHGQGWLVAQDPKTGESGLVPEEYVRLLRDIEGGWRGWVDNGGTLDEAHLQDLMDSARTPTQAEHGDISQIQGQSGNGSGSYYTPVVSTFSTSSKDFQQPMQIDKADGSGASGVETEKRKSRERSRTGEAEAGEERR